MTNKTENFLKPEKEGSKLSVRMLHMKLRKLAIQDLTKGL